MKEADMYPAVRAWLESLGLEVHVEVCSVDVIGYCRRASYAVAVHMKLANTDRLQQQCFEACRFANEVWAVVPTNTDRIFRFKCDGVGLLIWKDGKLTKKLAAMPQPWRWHKSRLYYMKKIGKRAPAMAHEVAGLPCCPALRAQRKIRRETVEECFV